MNADLEDLKYVEGFGRSLSPKEKAAARCSLRVAKEDNDVEQVYFWGVLYGAEGEYVIAVGLRKNPLESRVLLCSTDGGVTWENLPAVAAHEAHYCKHHISGLLKGRKDYEYVVVKEADVEPEEEKVEKEEVKKEEGEEEAEEETEEKPKVSRLRRISELVRVAHIVNQISVDTHVVPRGSYVLNSDQEITKNITFEGLDKSECGKLHNYQHLRAPSDVVRGTLLEREHLSRSLDFLDPVSEDVPTGCWTTQYDSFQDVVVLRSLLWPGYVFFHKPNSKHFGSCYFGNGQQNLDLAFMI